MFKKSYMTGEGDGKWNCVSRGLVILPLLC
jgi:hypothetical protein